MDMRETQRFARQLCEHSSSKQICGQILKKFTTGMSVGEAASFVYDIVTLDFFQDIPGKMKSFQREVAAFADELDELINETHNRDKDGEIIDSDADSDGNLR